MEPRRTEPDRTLTAGTTHRMSAEHVARDVQKDGIGDRQADPAGGRASRSTFRSAAAADSSRRGAGNGAGDRHIPGDPGRFTDGKALASYVGLIPGERSSGRRQRLGKVTKQGSPLLRFLWGEAGAHAVRRDPELKRFYRRKLVQKGLGKARVAVARKLGIRAVDHVAGRD